MKYASEELFWQPILKSFQEIWSRSKMELEGHSKGIGEAGRKFEVISGMQGSGE